MANSDRDEIIAPVILVNGDGTPTATGGSAAPVGVIQ